MRRFCVVIVVLFVFHFNVKAQIPYFASTPGDGNLYGYTSLKVRTGIDCQETYTCFQYGITEFAATGVDIYTGGNCSYMSVLVRGGYKANSWFAIGGQATPSFDLNNRMKYSYFTGAIYMNGNITNDGDLFWCTNTWLGLNRKVPNTYSQWIYLGYTISTCRNQSITPMIGEIHSWKFDQDVDLAIGAYYSVGNFNVYIWGNDFFREHPRVVFGIDFRLSTK